MMKVKKTLVVLFCVLVLTVGLSAQDKDVKNCEKFDKVITKALSHYGKFGVKVELIFVKETTHSPAYCCDVMLRITPATRNPEAKFYRWRICDGKKDEKSVEKMDSFGIIDIAKLIGCCEAAKQLPKDFVWETVELFNPDNPNTHKAIYRFCNADKTKCIGIVAYK